MSTVKSWSVDPIVLLGVALVLVGLILIASPLLAKRLRLEEAHPLLWFVLYRRDGLQVGTSPLLILVAVVLYLSLWLWRR